MRGKTAYNKYISAEMAAHQPKTPAEARAVMRKAAADWRGGELPVRSNPSGSGLMKLVVYGAIGYLALKAFGKLPGQQQA